MLQVFGWVGVKLGHEDVMLRIFQIGKQHCSLNGLGSSIVVN
jgi:hypothetical protein